MLPADRDRVRRRGRGHAGDRGPRAAVPSRAGRQRGRRARRGGVPGGGAHRRRGRPLDGRGVDRARRATSARARSTVRGSCASRDARARPRWHCPTSTTSLPLEPLTDGDAVALVTVATEDAPLRPHEIDDLVHRAAGNPLFLGELITLTRSRCGRGVAPRIGRGGCSPSRSTTCRRSPAACSATPPCSGGASSGRCSRTSSARPSTTATPSTRLARHLEADAGGAAALPPRARPRRRLRRAVVQAPARAAHPRRRGHRTPGRRPARRARRAPLAPLLRGRPSRRRVALRARRRGRTPTTPTRTSKPRRSTNARSRPDAGPAARAGRARHRRGVAGRRAGAHRRLPGGGRVVPAGPAAPAATTCPAQARTIVKEARGRRAPGPLLDVGALDPQGPAAPRRRSRRRRVERPGPARRDVRRDPPGPGRARESRWSGASEAITEAETAEDRDALAHAYRILDWAWMDLGRAGPGDPLDRCARRSTRSSATSTGQATAANNLGVAAYLHGRLGAGHRVVRAGPRPAGPDRQRGRRRLRHEQRRRDPRQPGSPRRGRAAVRGRPAHLAGGRLPGRRRVRHHAPRPDRRPPRRDGPRRRAARPGPGRVRGHRSRDRRPREPTSWAPRPRSSPATPSAPSSSPPTRCAREAAIGGSAVHGSALRRLRGEANLWLGRVDDAREELELSLAVARANGADYEIALTLAVLERVGRMQGRPLEDAATVESREILERLGVRAVVWTPPATRTAAG